MSNSKNQKEIRNKLSSFQDIDQSKDLLVYSRRSDCRTKFCDIYRSLSQIDGNITINYKLYSYKNNSGNWDVNKENSWNISIPAGHINKELSTIKNTMDDIIRISKQL